MLVKARAPGRLSRYSNHADFRCGVGKISAINGSNSKNTTSTAPNSTPSGDHFDSSLGKWGTDLTNGLQDGVGDGTQAARLGFDRFSNQNSPKKGKLEEVANTSQQLFGAGNTQKASDILPTFLVNWGKKGRVKLDHYADANVASDTRLARSARFLDNLSINHPTLVSRLRLVGRWAGPVAAIASTVWSSIDLAQRWNKLTSGAKAANVVATAATGFGAAAAVAALAKVPGAGMAAWGGLGLASTIYQGITTWRYFHDPKATPGMRDISMASTIVQAVGVGMMFFPPLAPIGLALSFGGGIAGSLAGWIGKWGPVNSACKWIDKKLAPVAHVASRVVEHVGHFFSSIF